MSNNDYIINSLNIPNVSIDKIETSDVSISYFISTKPSTQSCPCCSTPTSYIHDYRTQKIKDLPIHLSNVTIVLRKRRYVCPKCGKKFYEHLDFINKYKRVTNRVRYSVICSLHKISTMSDIALKHNVSHHFVQDILHSINPATNSCSSVLSIDEFKGDADKEKYQVILTNPVDKHILDILPSRNKLYLDAYFKQLPNKNNVKYVIMDMWRPYYDLARMHFKNATIIIDRYHFIRQVTWAMENIRKRVQRHLDKDSRIFFKQSKKILLKAYDKLTLQEKDSLYLMFAHSEELRLAYELKSWFYSILQERNKETIKREIRNWVEALEDSKIKEFKECIRAFKNWEEPIINGIIYPYSNAYTEGKNNKTKVLKRISYGIRTFENLRKRVLLINQNMSYWAI